MTPRTPSASLPVFNLTYSSWPYLLSLSIILNGCSLVVVEQIIYMGPGQRVYIFYILTPKSEVGLTFPLVLITHNFLFNEADTF